MDIRIRYIIPNIVFIILVVIQVLPGSDLNHHLQNARLFHEMIKNQTFLAYNPYLLHGKQPTFVYGSILYLGAGLIWPIFNIFTIDVMAIFALLLMYFTIRKFSSNWKVQTLSLLAASLYVIQDAFVALYSCLFFWLAILFYYNKRKKSAGLSLLTSVLIHPFSLIPALFFVYKEKKNIIVLLIAVAFHSVMYSFFSHSVGSFFILMPFMVFVRSIECLFPVIAGIYFGKMEPQIGKYFKKIKVSAPTAFILVFLVELTATNLFIESPANYGPFFNGYKDYYSGFPKIKGNMRVVDYNHNPTYFNFHSDGLTIETGSFLENNFFITYHAWTDETTYVKYLKDHDITHVLLCLKCGTMFAGTNAVETTYLARNHDLIWKNDYYYLYEIKWK